MDILVSVRILLVSGSVSQILVPTISLESVDGIPPNLPGCSTGTSLRADWVLVTLTSFSMSQKDLGDKFRYPQYLMNLLMEFPQIYLNKSLGHV